ncbi:MAG: FHA domain-containing protein [Gemmatimonadaceae bacterium]|nr:FHA domain-containing protein [Gemmatimonadaceae bacterium]
MRLRAGGVATIGRAPDATVAFHAVMDRIVSRRHAQLTRVSAGTACWEIADLNSRHGVFVNGQRLRGNMKLSVGDEVQLGPEGPLLVVAALS